MTRVKSVTEIIRSANLDGRRQGWLEGAIACAVALLLLGAVR